MLSADEARKESLSLTEEDKKTLSEIEKKIKKAAEDKKFEINVDMVINERIRSALEKEGYTVEGPFKHPNSPYLYFHQHIDRISWYPEA